MLRALLSLSVTVFAATLMLLVLALGTACRNSAGDALVVLGPCSSSQEWGWSHQRPMSPPSKPSLKIQALQRWAATVHG